MPQLASNPRARLIAVLGASAATVVALTSVNEGVSLKPWDDRLAGHVQTVCFGETNIAMRPYTMPECRDMLAGSLAGYAESVKAMTPGFDTLTDGQRVSLVDFSYNVGLANYKGSTLRAMMIRKDLPAACEQFMHWRYVNHGKTDCSVAANRCAGIYKRRLQERAACLSE